MNDILIITILFTILAKSYADNRCEANHLSCGGASESCYHPSWICDGEVDCPATGKDEMNCDTHTCEEGQFQCKMGHCIDGHRRCNHFEDCNDRTDEIDCEWTCEAEEFKCARTGKCLTPDLRCNGDFDCGSVGGDDDMSDETNCQGLRGNSCDDKQFHCPDSDKCISSKWRCDGADDCPNGEDEENCHLRPICRGGFLCDDNRNCINSTQICDQRRDCEDGTDEQAELCFEECKPPARWACGGGGYGYCISYSAKCDGFSHCQDGSDEQNCGTNAPCDGGFRCKTGICIPEQWRCDDHDDCRDGVRGGSDELNCDVCQKNEFKCQNKTCIDNSLLCNGVNDCPNGKDEEHCLPKGQECDSGFKCGTSTKCIPKWLFCNNHNDCGDNSDEPEICVPWDRCSENNGDCEHFCDPLAGGNRNCGCKPGYQLDTDQSSCIDIDECRNHTNPVCSQHCTNEEASYSCYCEEGYQLAENNKSCFAIETKPYLVFSVVYKMKKTNLNGTVSEVLFTTNHTSGLDYDYRNERWFWVSVMAKGFNTYETSVKSKPFDGADVQNIYNDVHISINDMAVDWVSGKVYIAAINGTRGLIRAIDPTSHNYTDIVHREIRNPSSIVLDPSAGLVFWSDIDELEKGDIGRCDMDGGNKVILANDVGWANGITVDFVRQKVIWIDAGSVDLEVYGGRIEEMDYDGGNRRVVKHLTPYVHKPWTISIFQDDLFWADSEQEAIIKCDRFNTSKVEKVRTGLKVVVAVKVVHPLRQPVSPDYCQNHTCSHICVLKPGGYSCRCPRDEVLQNNTTCVKPAYQVECDDCPPSTSQGNDEKFSKKNSTKKGQSGLQKVRGLSWWICLIIVLLTVIIIVTGIIGCKQPLSTACKPCVNRLTNRDNEARTRQNNQDYMQISLQPTSTCTTGTLVTEISDTSISGGRTKLKESDI